MANLRVELKQKFPIKKLTQLGISMGEEFRDAIHRAVPIARTPRRRRGIQSRSGKLFASIRAHVTRAGSRIQGKLTADWPGTVLEFGGTIPARDVEPRGARALAFSAGGEMIIRARAHIPAVTIPPHPFLRPAVRQTLREFRSAVRREIRKVAA